MFSQGYLLRSRPFPFALAVCVYYWLSVENEVTAFQGVKLTRSCFDAEILGYDAPSFPLLDLIHLFIIFVLVFQRFHTAGIKLAICSYPPLSFSYNYRNGKEGCPRRAPFHYHSFLLFPYLLLFHFHGFQNGLDAAIILPALCCRVVCDGLC
jgi:hypothetical protein